MVLDADGAKTTNQSQIIGISLGPLLSGLKVYSAVPTDAGRNWWCGINRKRVMFL